MSSATQASRSFNFQPCPQDEDRQRLLRQRRHAERILELSEHLDAPDRLLLEQIYRQGKSVREVALLLNIEPRALQRRVVRLLRHLRDPLFVFVATRFDVLPREVQATARRAILEGRSLRCTARLTRQSLHRVRQHVKFIRALQQIL